MHASDLAVDVLLALGVAAQLLCVAGILVMRTTLDRLHYAAACTTVPAFLILAATLLPRATRAAEQPAPTADEAAGEVTRTRVA